MVDKCMNEMFCVHLHSRTEDDHSYSDDGTGCGAGAGRPSTNRRVITNRQSAQRSRTRKLQYISELEAHVGGLQRELAKVQPEVEAWQRRHAGSHFITHQIKLPEPWIRRTVCKYVF